jgi:hypothetical protein
VRNKSDLGVLTLACHQSMNSLLVVLTLGSSVLTACTSSESPSSVSTKVGSTKVGITPVELNDGEYSVGKVDTPTGGGFIVIYSDVNGGPGKVVAKSSFIASSKTDVRFREEERNGVWVMIHADADGDRRLTFPGPDAPVTDPSTGSLLLQKVSR